MSKTKRWLDYLIISLVIIYIVGFIVFGILDFSGHRKGDEFPYMLKKLIELGPAFVLAFFINESVKTNRELNRKFSNLSKHGISNVFPNGVTDDLDSNDFFQCNEIKICVIAGVGFLEQHVERIETGLKFGTNIKLLIADKKSVFVEQNNEMLLAVSFEGKNGDKNLKKEIEDAETIIKEIQKKQKENGWKGTLECRKYETEYRGKYVLRFLGKNEDNQIEAYFNMTVPVRGPQYSLLFYGKAYADDRKNFLENDEKGIERNVQKGNMIFDMNLHFDYLWDKYKHTSLQQ